MTNHEDPLEVLKLQFSSVFLLKMMHDSSALTELNNLLLNQF